MDHPKDHRHSKKGRLFLSKPRRRRVLPAGLVKWKAMRGQVSPEELSNPEESGSSSINVLESLCRLCRSKSTTYMDIFKDDGRLGGAVAVVIEDLLRVEVAERVGFPRIICSVCHEKINGFKDFKESCLQTQAAFEEQLSCRQDHRIFLENSLQIPVVKIENFERDDYEESDSQDMKPGFLGEQRQKINIDDFDPWGNLITKDEPVSDGVDEDEAVINEYNPKNEASDDCEAAFESDGATETEKVIIKDEIEITEHPVSVSIPVVENVYTSLSVGEDRKTEISEEVADPSITLFEGSVLEEKVLRYAEETSREDVGANTNGRVVRKKNSIPIQTYETDRHENESSSDQDIVLKRSRKGKASTFSKKKNKRVSKQQKHTCETCSKTFNNKYHFNRHVRIHNRIFTCETCSETFNNKCDFNKHIRIHNRDLSFLCDFCNKPYRSKYTLSEHMWIHLGTKPHRCKLCESSYSRLANLRRHEAVHGDKKYPCKICAKFFPHESLLRSHQKRHFKDLCFFCDWCKIGFGSKFILAGHMMLHS